MTTRRLIGYTSVKCNLSNLANNYVESRALEPNQHEFDALVIQVYNGAHYSVMDAFGNTSLNDTQALDKALETYEEFKGWDDYKNGWTNRLSNVINLYRNGDYTKRIKQEG